MALVSFALPILLGGSPATAQTTPPDTSQSDTIANLQDRLAQAREERKEAQTAFEEAGAESDKADADYVAAKEAYDQAQDAFEALRDAPNRDQVAFRQARETRNTARQTMLAAREARNVARTALVAAREARNVASDRVQDLRTKLAEAQEAEAQVPVLALQSEIDALNEQMNNLIAQAAIAAAAAAKDLLDAEQRATAAEQQATDAEQRATAARQEVTVAEEETAEAEEQVADLELNLYEAHEGCRIEETTKDGEKVYRTETDKFMCLSRELILLDTCIDQYLVHKITSRHSLESKGTSLHILYSSSTNRDASGIPYRVNKGASFTDVKVRTFPFQSIEIQEESGNNISISSDGTILDGRLPAGIETDTERDEYIADMMDFRDRILAIVNDEITENPLPICE